MPIRRVRPPVVFALLALPSWGFAAMSIEAADDFTTLSLEELSNLKISSVSKRQEPLSDTAASVYVITADDIRRSGAVTLPDALRLAPNLHVAQTSASSWAISARGLNSTTANKLLVLIDGRPVYTPLYSGVFWDAQDVYMPDVERIEVISGPNATTWGSNAVNGVINVVTREAGASEGTQAGVLAGDRRHQVQAHKGGTASAGAFRVYGKYAVEDETEDALGAGRRDAMRRAQAGFRVDLDNQRDAFTLQGDVYDGDIDRLLAGDTEISGGNVLAHWNRALDGGDTLNLTGYYDRTNRLMPGTVEEHLDTVGLEARRQVNGIDGHSIVVGADVRHARDRIGNFEALAFRPERRELTWASVFAHDHVQVSEQFGVALGLRVEHNDFTGVELMPNARFNWRANERHVLWASLSRAVRTPSRIDTEFTIPAEPPFAVVTSPGFESETAKVLELGWRGNPSANFLYSLTAFRHEYDRLRSLEILPDGAIALENRLRGTGTGLEGWMSYTPFERWKLAGGFLYLDKDFELRPGSTALVANEGNDPEYQLQLRSSFDVNANHQADIALRHVAELPQPFVPAYTVVDANWMWSNQRGLTLSLHVRNLFDKRHAEFGNPDNRSEFGRETHLQLAWSFR